MVSGAPLAGNALREQLQKAVVAGNAEEIATLLQARADPGGAAFKGPKSLLLHAATLAERSREVCELLITHKADVTAKEPRLKQTPLFMACKPVEAAGGADCATLLIKNHCDPNYADVNGQTPLFYAVQRQSSQCAMALLAEGAEITHVDKLGQTACMFANRSNAASLLYRAVTQSAAADVQMLLQKQADPTTWMVTGGQNLAFIAAARSREAVEVCKLLVERRVDPTCEDSRYKQTPLFFAVRGVGGAGGLDCCRFLLNHGCTPSHVDCNGQTPLFYSAQRADCLCTEELIAAKADVNHVDSRGQTACFFASRHDGSDVMDSLLNHGASTGIADVIGQTALFYAKSSAIVNMLVKNQADVNHRDLEARTPLMVTATLGFEPAVHALCAAKADMQCRNKEGRTCLFFAARAGLKRMCHLLLEKGADPSVKDEQGMLAADVVTHAVPSEAAELQALLRQGAQSQVSTKRKAGLSVEILDEVSTAAGSSVKRSRQSADEGTPSSSGSLEDVGREELPTDLGSIPLRDLEVGEAVEEADKQSAMLLHFSKNTFQEERELVEYRIFMDKECGCRTWLLLAPYTPASVVALQEIVPPPAAPSTAQLQAVKTTRTRKRGSKTPGMDPAKPAPATHHALAAVTVRINKYSQGTGAWAQILNMSARRERNGLGTMLVAGLEVLLHKDCGVDVVVLYPAQNGRAPAFWSSLGYRNHESASLLPVEDLVPHNDGGRLLPEFDPQLQKRLPRWEKRLGPRCTAFAQKPGETVAKQPVKGLRSNKAGGTPKRKGLDALEPVGSRLKGQPLLQALKQARKARQTWKSSRSRA